MKAYFTKPYHIFSSFKEMSNSHLFTGFMLMNFLFANLFSIAQTPNSSTKNVQKKGMNYQNPVLHKDYSDPDVIRVGDTYIMTASSFNHTPGLPLLTSKDLIHWQLTGHALDRLVPEDHFKVVRHGNGVWAPAIRYHNNTFYIYYPDPDFGIYMIQAKSIQGPWSEPLLILGGKGYIDPCPFWDDNGKAYLIHAYAGSRAGIKSILSIKEMNQAGDKIIHEGTIIYDGHGIDPTIEGPKLHKRNGYYYVFAPAGGVSTGWQTILRSKTIYGPYERKVVMDQGNTTVNGPHQGAWVQSPDGADWFLHFQDKESYGRIVHLQPMTWNNDWPIIGNDLDGDGKGEPVNDVAANQQMIKVTVREEFDQPLSLEWQWQANSAVEWKYLNNGKLRLFARTLVDSSKNKYQLPNLLLQKFPAEQFEAKTQINFERLQAGEEAGLIVFGNSYAWLGVINRNNQWLLTYSECLDAAKGQPEKIRILDTLNNKSSTVFLKAAISYPGKTVFSYSYNDKNEQIIDALFVAQPGKWVGAKAGIFACGSKASNDCGSADFHFFEMTYPKTN